MLSTQSMPIVQAHLAQRAQLSQAIIDPEYPLHYCAFFGLLDRLNQALIGIDPDQLNKQDCYGNTALHIAIMLGHRDCAEALLAAKCAVSIRNREGWNPLSEAISYGSHSLTKKLYKILRGQMFDREKVDHFGQILHTIPDCQLDFEWEIVTWMPFLSKVLPSDVCCIRKIGNCLRLDTSLIDISALSSTRGDMSVVFNPSTHPSMLILNHKKKTFQSIGAKHMHSEHDVEVLRSTELLHMRLCLDKMVCNRNGARHARWSPSIGKVMVGKYHTTTYTINHLCFNTIKRTEHLKENQKLLHRQRHSRRSKRASSAGSEKSTLSLRSTSLSPPRGYKRDLLPNECNPAPVTWDAYRSGELKPSKTYLGRKPELHQSEKQLKLTVAMTDEIPLNVTQLLDMLQVISPLNKFNKLRKALQTGLPAGFPVRMEMPLVPTTTGRIVFKDVKLLDSLDVVGPVKSVAPDPTITQSASIGSSQFTDLFVVPRNYRYVGEFKLSKPRKKQFKRAEM